MENLEISPRPDFTSLFVEDLNRLWPSQIDQSKWLDLGKNKTIDINLKIQSVLKVCCFWREHGLYNIDASLKRPWETERNPRAILKGIKTWVQSCVKIQKRSFEPDPWFIWVGYQSEKTFENHLSGKWRWDRREFWWLDALAEPSRLDPGRFLFHERTCASLRVWWEEPVPVLERALVLGGLLAMYQHHRPTQEARANRGRAKPRRKTPRAIAALQEPFIGKLQADKLLELCTALNRAGCSDQAAPIALVVMECLFYQAHLRPHPETVDARPSPSLLKTLEQRLNKPETEELLGPHSALFRARLDRMRAYEETCEEKRICSEKEKSKWPNHPYLAASEDLEWIYKHRKNPPSVELVERIERLERLASCDAPGLAMLTPQIKRKRQKLDATQEAKL